MPKRTYRDFDEFADALSGVAGRFVPTARSEAEWWVQAEPIGALVFQEIQTGGPAAFVGEGKDDAVTIGVPKTTPAHIRIDGRSLDERAVILVNEQQPFAVCAERSTRWAGITIPRSHPYLPAEIAAGPSAKPCRSAQVCAHADLEWVVAIKSIVSGMLANERLIGADDAMLRAAESDALYAVSRLLESAADLDDARAGRPRYSRGRVLARALQLIESRRGKPLFVQDLCRATQVSERTLRNIFQEYFGVGPVRLLKLNRLHEIRAALIASDPHEEHVWKIAARFGVWDLSVFAREYKALYGEMPHQTLRAPAKPRDPTLGPTWIRYASRKLAQAAQRAAGRQDVRT